jgi:hypothetical protein
MLKYYYNTCIRSFKLAAKNWPVMFVLIVYSLIMGLVSIAVSPLGFLGGFITAIASAACASSYLYLIENIIYSRIASMNDFKNSFTPYLRRVINISFYIWIATTLYSFVSRAFYTLSYGWVINIIVELAAVIVLNPIPEIIYQTNNSDMGVFSAAYEFMKENFVEWIVPNLLLLAAVYFLIGGGLFSFLSINVLGIVKFVIGLFVVLFTMIFRGILFRFLNESTRRSRLFKLRMLDLQ